MDAGQRRLKIWPLVAKSVYALLNSTGNKRYNYDPMFAVRTGAIQDAGFDVYSKRKKKAEKAGQPDVYQYDTLPRPLCIQIKGGLWER